MDLSASFLRCDLFLTTDDADGHGYFRQDLRDQQDLWRPESLRDRTALGNISGPSHLMADLLGVNFVILTSDL